MKLLALPRTVGVHPNGNEIIAALGRFGPYLKCGDVNISLPPEDHPATITLERAVHICTEGVEKKLKMMEPIAELGVDPETKGKVVVKDGRFGPYITDGKTNVTIPKTKDPKEVTFDEAVAMLAKKRSSPKRAWKGRKKSAASEE